MTAFRIVAAALACSLLLSTFASAAEASVQRGYASTLVAAAQRIERAAKANAPVPAMHIPPAPLGGPPRFSPSLDDWLQRSLDAARRTKSAKTRAASLATIAASLRYVATGAGSANSTAAPRTDLEAAAKSILAESAYRVSATKPAQPQQPTIWDRILNWIIEKIDELFGRLATATQKVPIVGVIIGYAIVGAAIIGLAFVGYRLARRLTSRRDTAVAGVGEVLPLSTNPDELYALARDEARSGNTGQAVALLYQTALVLLDRVDRIAYDPSRTPGEYRRLVHRNAQTIADAFDALARLFVAVAFGRASAGADDWRRADAAFSGIRRSLGAAQAA
ncbi:MAG TPA: DUF4129 domain-containing protein [Candidatus Eremiobacteraceae bacterium]|nr:DUF4129 domain-containing protein [Candidatus Eremiobacteraceae bacterium]